MGPLALGYFAECFLSRASSIVRAVSLPTWPSGADMCSGHRKRSQRRPLAPKQHMKQTCRLVPLEPTGPKQLEAEQCVRVWVLPKLRAQVVDSKPTKLGRPRARFGRNLASSCPSRAKFRRSRSTLVEPGTDHANSDKSYQVTTTMGAFRPEMARCGNLEQSRWHTLCNMLSLDDSLRAHWISGNLVSGDAPLRVCFRLPGQPAQDSASPQHPPRSMSPLGRRCTCPSPCGSNGPPGTPRNCQRRRRCACLRGTPRNMGPSGLGRR